LAWKWVSSFKVFGGAGIVLLGVVPVIHGEVVHDTLIPVRNLSICIVLLHEINLSVTSDGFSLVSSLSWVVNWFVFAPALLINTWVEVFMETNSSVGTFNIVVRLFLGMEPLLEVIKSSDMLIGKRIVFGTIVENTWAKASVGSIALGLVDTEIWLVVPCVNLEFTFLLETDIGIPLLGHGVSILGFLTIGSLEFWLSIEKSLRLIFGEFVGTGTKTSSVFTDVDEVLSRISSDITVSVAIALNIGVTQTRWRVRGQNSKLCFGHTPVWIVVNFHRGSLIIDAFLNEFSVLKLIVHGSEDVHVGFLGLVELFDQVNELDSGGVLGHVFIDNNGLVAAHSGIRDLELRLIDS